MPHTYQERNIAITPHLMQYLREEGRDTGIGLSRKRTIHGESWEEWFCTHTPPDEVIEIFTTHDPTLHYDGEIQGRHVVKNCDRRLGIYLQDNPDRGFTSVWVRYRPDKWSLEQ